MLIPICAQFHYAYGDSPYANCGDQFLTCQRSFLKSCVESELSHASRVESEFCKCTTCTLHVQNMKSPYTYRDQDQSPYAYGDQVNPCMHTGIACHAIPVCIQGSKSIPVCIRRSQRSTCNPCMHTGICAIPVCIRGFFSH